MDETGLEGAFAGNGGGSGQAEQGAAAEKGQGRADMADGGAMGGSQMAAAAGAGAEGGKGEAKAGGGDSGGKDGSAAKAGNGGSAGGFDKAAWEKFVSGVDPALGMDPQALKGFGELSERLGLSAEKAGEMFGFAVEEARRYNSRMREGTERLLREEWGGGYERRMSGARALIERVDRALGEKGCFGRIIESSGLGNNPDFIRGMDALAGLFGEDSLGEAAAGGWRGREETPYEGLKGFFK